MKDHLTIYLFKLLKWWIRREYGYCDYEEKERIPECFTCRASIVQDWLENQIINIKEWNK